MKKINIYIIFFTLVYTKSIDSYEYKIQFLGIPVANCIVNYSDTIISNIEYKKLDYKVITTSFINRIFKIENHYTTIVNKLDYSTKYYKKKTYQPNVVNNISTSFIDGKLRYDNSDISINKNDFNIFTILYLFQLGEIDKLKNINYIEREGKYYNFIINEINNNQFKLIIEERDKQEFGIIKDTDIFLWGLFLNKSDRRISIDPIDNTILKCTFQKGLTIISAKLK